MKEIVNAKITSTMLGLEDHGIMTSFITLEWDGGGVSYGGYVLGGESAIPYIKEILAVVGVDKWEDLKGKYCRLETNGPGTIPTRIGNLMKDRWLDQKEFFKKYE